MAKIQPEILTELAVNATKRFLKSDEKKPDLSAIIADEVTRAQKLHKVKFSKQHLQTICQMTNRAVHKAKFARDRFVEFTLATPETVVSKMKGPKPELPKGPQTVVSVKEFAKQTTTTPARKFHAVHIDIKKKLPGYRNEQKAMAAETVMDRINQLVLAINDALREVSPEEIFGAALAIDESRGNSRLRRLLQKPLEKQGLDLNKAIAYTGMSPDMEDPLICAMTKFHDAVEIFEKAAKRATRAWVI